MPQIFDPSMAHYASKLAEKRNELVLLQINRQFDAEINELLRLPAWETMVRRFAKIESDQMERLTKGELSQYQLGKIQGIIAGLRIMMSARPKSPDDLAQLDKQDTLLRNEITELTRLIGE